MQPLTIPTSDTITPHNLASAEHEAACYLLASFEASLRAYCLLYAIRKSGVWTSTFASFEEYLQDFLATMTLRYGWAPSKSTVLDRLTALSRGESLGLTPEESLQAGPHFWRAVARLGKFEYGGEFAGLSPEIATYLNASPDDLSDQRQKLAEFVRSHLAQLAKGDAIHELNRAYTVAHNQILIEIDARIYRCQSGLGFVFYIREAGHGLDRLTVYDPAEGSPPPAVINWLLSHGFRWVEEER